MSLTPTHNWAITDTVPSSALLNGGYKVSRSHATGGSIKTNAPRSFVMDIVREGAKLSPVRMDKVAENSPVRPLLAKPQTHTIDLKYNEEAKQYARDPKTVYYQVNPLPNWGPAPRARVVKVDENGAEVPNKRKSEADDEVERNGASDAKRTKVEETAAADDDEEAVMNA